MIFVCLLNCYIWTEQAFSKRLYIIWKVLYSITWIPWRSILVNINFHAIQFLLKSVFLHNGMKTYLFAICLFIFFAKAIPQNVLNLSKSYWLILHRCNFDIGKNFVGKNFSTCKIEEISQKIPSFSTTVFIIIFHNSIYKYL